MATERGIALVFDCGATNVRVIAIDTDGRIIASKSAVNETDADPNFEGGRIWDLDKLWGKLSLASQQVVAQIDSTKIVGVTFTTFGVDGTLIDSDGKALYPIISWQCSRTQEIVERCDKGLIYNISGVYPYPFNTLFKLMWFRENRADILDRAERFVFLPSLLIGYLTGEFRNDHTMLGTAALCDLSSGEISQQLLDMVGVDRELFGPIAHSGDLAGVVTAVASQSTGIPIGTKVFYAGHDTQFAIFGSSAQQNQAVLSSGTWEILMARSGSFRATDDELNDSITTEMDSIFGLYNIGQNWLGSGIVEWCLRNFYPDLSGDELYNTAIGEIRDMQPREHNLRVNPDFQNHNGSIGGLTINTPRNHIFAALIESLAFRLRRAVETLEAAGGFKISEIICVGGGSKNMVWNQMRADISQRPIKIIDQKETTVLGAAMFVFSGAGLFDSVEKARENIDYKFTMIEPNSDRGEIYEELYREYLKNK